MEINNKKKISIILPVYNAEKYLKKCLDSIIEQSYTNFELLVINDGSIDKSQEIIDLYLKKDKRIKKYKIDNHGQSYARNFGLERVSGQYITFIDSDDYYSKNFLKILLNNCIKYDADVSVCNFYKVINEKRIMYCSVENKIIEFTDRKLDVLFEQKYFQTQMWNKLYKAELFKEVRFPENKIYEDLYVNFKIFKSARKIVFDSTPLYNYVYNPTSSLNMEFSIKKMDFLKVCEQIEKELNNENLSTNGISQMRRYLYICTCNLLSQQNVQEHKKEFKEMRIFLLRNILKIMLDNYKLKYKIAAIFLTFFPNIYIKINKMQRR